MLYTVGEMAKLLGIAASTPRYYDQEGLLPFVERSQGGMRMFSDRDYAPLVVIGCLRKAGLSVKEVREVIGLAGQGDETLARRLAIFERRKAEVEKQIEDLQKMLAVLEYKCWYYRTACAARTEDAVRHCCCSDVPEAYRTVFQKLTLEDE